MRLQLSSVTPLVLFSLACGPKLVRPEIPPTPPEWIQLSGRIEPDETPQCEKSRFGVGSASGIKNRSLLENTATHRARADLADRMKACWAKHLDGKFRPESEISPEEARISSEGALKYLVSEAINGATVVRRWEAPDGTLHVYLEAPPTKEAPPSEKGRR